MLGWMEGLICEMHQDKCSAFCKLSFPGSCLRGVMLLEAELRLSSLEKLFTVINTLFVFPYVHFTFVFAS